MDLSIVIPAYNAADYIACCLRSVLICPKDTMTMECIVVNDGSKDETAAIVHRYQERDARIILLNKENGGVSDTRNYGLAHAKGTYIMFLDADDSLCEDAWEHIADAIHNSYGEFMSFSYLTLFENGKMVPQPLSIEDSVSTDSKEARRLMYASSEFNTCWGKLFLRDIVEQYRIQFRRDLPIGEDFLFVADYFSHCTSFFMSKAMILYYLQRSGSAMRSYSMEQRLNFTKILYEYNRDAVTACQDEELVRQMNVYYLRVVTNLFREYAGTHKGKELEEIYRNALDNVVIRDILDAIEENEISSKMKKLEFMMLKNNKIGILRRYFSLKAKI